MICGVDEAGRGPLIGPMVMAAVSVEKEDSLPKGCKDSKQLTPKKREELFEQLKKVKHVIRIVQSDEVDEWVNQNKLNWLEAKYTIEMLQELKPKTAIIDCPHKNLEAYAKHIQDKTPDTKIITMFKADQKHPSVSAASIIAKVIRDREVKKLHEEINFDFGSGYLTDPKTQSLLTEKFDPKWPHYRKSWQPYKDKIAQSQQQSLF